ncbi:MAG: hypothetical protein ABMA15_20775 [Vicinamibacterales bacterium]
MRGARHPFVFALVAVAVGAIAFIYRFNTLGGPLAGFDNDHFRQLIRAEAMLDGEQPLRDFADAELRALWPPLTYSTSAFAQRVLGRSLRSEAILTVGMLAVGAATLCWVAAAFGGILPAAWATLLAVGLSPTLYNYPKIVPYVLTVLAMFAYARRPGLLRLAAIALAIVIAALFRHDHGVFVGVSAAVLLVFVHWPRVWPPWLRLGGFVLIGLLPGLVFVQLHGGVVSYLRNGLELSRQEATRTIAPAPAFEFDWSQPWLVHVEAPPPPRPRIGVRWATFVTPEIRLRAEQTLGLDAPSRRNDDSNWSYAIDDPSPRRLQAIVGDPRVADTDGINRQAFRLTDGAAPPKRGWLEDHWLFQWRVAPGLLRTANAGPWLYLTGWLVIGCAAFCLAVPRLRRATTDLRVPMSAVAAVCVMGVILFATLLRNPAPFRLPDASVPIVVLGAWLLGALPRAARSRPSSVRTALTLFLSVAVGLTTLSVAAVGSVREQIGGTGAYDGLPGLRARWHDVSETLGALPASTTGIDERIAVTARYLRRCTAPSDRLLVTDNLPEIHYFAQRGVAAGQSAFFSHFYSSPEAQREAIERWSRQSVPIALLQPPERFEEEFAREYPLLAAYLRAHYRRAGSLEVERGVRSDVWVTVQRQAVPDAETGLPCFAAG